MRMFFSSTFMEPKSLKEEGIYHPIKLEYYKIINEDDITKHEKAKFGIKVVKTEDKKIQYVSNDEKRIEDFLNLLKENEVTPIAVEDILNDFSRKLFWIKRLIFWKILAKSDKLS